MKNELELIQVNLNGRSRTFDHFQSLLRRWNPGFSQGLVTVEK